MPLAILLEIEKCEESGLRIAKHFKIVRTFTRRTSEGVKCITNTKTYSIIYRDVSECEKKGTGSGKRIIADQNLFDLTGIQENQVQLYPNPSNDQLSIAVEGERDFSVRLMNLQGQIVLQKSNANSTTQIDVANFPAGIYMAEITSGGEVIRKKWVKN